MALEDWKEGECVHLVDQEAVGIGIIPKKRAVIDIDGILWSMGKPWQDEIHKINPDCPFPGVGKWNFYEGYLTNEELVHTIKAVHMKQHRHEMFDNACRLSLILKEAGYYIVMASHRDPESYNSTAWWLEKNDFYFDELHTTEADKSYLMKFPTEIFIDDAPHTQEKVVAAGIESFSIKYPYNKHVEGVNFYEDFDAMVDGIAIWATDYETRRRKDVREVWSDTL